MKGCDSSFKAFLLERVCKIMILSKPSCWGRRGEGEYVRLRFFHLSLGYVRLLFFQRGRLLFFHKGLLVFLDRMSQSTYIASQDTQATVETVYEAGGLDAFNNYILSLTPSVISGEMKISPFLEAIRKKYKEMMAEPPISIDGVFINSQPIDMDYGEEEEVGKKRKKGGRPKTETPAKATLYVREHRAKRAKKDGFRRGYA
jgi:hypothetical protein